MPTIKELVDKFKGFGRSVKEAPEADTPTDAETAAEGTEDEATGEQETVVTEEVIAALSLLGDQTEHIIKAIGLIDQRVESISQLATQNQAVVRGMAKTEVERVQDALKDGEWYKTLFVASRDADAIPKGETPPELSGGEMQVPEAGAGLLGPVMNSAGR